MDLFISILAVVAGVAGIVGSIMPALPGPPLSWLGLLILFLWGNGTDSAGNPLALKGLLIWGAVVVAVTVIDYFVPMYFTKITGGSRYAEKGAMVGLIAGIILTPVGMILGSFLGAFLFELYYSRKGVEPALKAALGSFLGFITGTGIKTIVSCLILWRIIVFL